MTAATVVQRNIFVDGVWVNATGGMLPVLDPATEELIAEAGKVSDADLAAALASTRRGGLAWRETPGWERGRILDAIAARIRAEAEPLAQLMTREQGKPITESRGELIASAEAFAWFADEARRIYGRVIAGRTPDRQLLVLSEAVGPVAAFTPSNFPWLLAARKIAAALAAGCSVLHKPAEETPLSALAMAALASAAGLPPGVLNVVTGDPALIGSTLVRSDVIRMVSLTGSVPVGKTLLRESADTVKRVFMELGGHAPVIVLPGSDPVTTARDLVNAKFRNCGQVCVSPSRIFVADDVYDELLPELLAHTAKLAIGPGAQDGTDVGPLVSARRLAAVEALVADAVAKGATVSHGGGRTAGHDTGFFYDPTVLTDVTPEMAVMTEEPFGPILPLVRWDDLDATIDAANSLEVGLAGYVIGPDALLAGRVARRLEVGMVGVNSYGLAAAEAPFGGIKQSGFGVEAGAEGIREYLDIRYLNLPC
jgi:succinate-semialdehyde dehydrogenase/glutarate-semialdehyde dehydrogenase